MNKIDVNQKKSTYFGAVAAFDFGVNMGKPQRFGAFSEVTMVETMKKENAPKTDQTTEFAVNVQTFRVEMGHIFPEESQFSISSRYCC